MVVIQSTTAEIRRGKKN